MSLINRNCEQTGRPGPCRGQSKQGRQPGLLAKIGHAAAAPFKAVGRGVANAVRASDEGLSAIGESVGTVPSILLGHYMDIPALSAIGYSRALSGRFSEDDPRANLAEITKAEAGLRQRRVYYRIKKSTRP